MFWKHVVDLSLRWPEHYRYRDGHTKQVQSIDFFKVKIDRLKLKILQKGSPAWPVIQFHNCTTYVL